MPDDVVEMAVKARYDFAREGEGTEWDDLTRDQRADVMRRHGPYMRHALAAVLPEIQAQALRDAAAVFAWAGDDEDYAIIRTWLRDRADRLTATTEGQGDGEGA